MDLQEALDNFRSAVVHCDNLIEIHRTHGGNNRGVRTKEPSLNRAVVVLAAAAWQAAVQDACLSCIDLGAPRPPAPPQSLVTYRLQTGYFNKAIQDFATPNAENTRKLLKLAGLDILQYWTWSHAGTRKRPHEVSETINKWLKVRHALAHGHAELPQVDVLEVVRQNLPNRNSPSLRRDDAEACVRFFKKLVEVTLSGIANEYNIPAPV